MSIAQRKISWISPREYLEGEEFSPIRHEYADGHVFAMAGASSPHGRISGNLFVLIDTHLRSQPCETFIADMKVGISAAGPYYYPDVVVTCHPGDRRSSFVKRHPRMIIEVLSPRTSTLDRGDKLNDYCSLPSLEEYLLVSQDEQYVERLRRTPDGGWDEHAYGVGDTIPLESIGLSIAIEQIYDRVQFGGYGEEDEGPSR